MADDRVESLGNLGKRRSGSIHGPVFLFSLFGGIIADQTRKSTFLKQLQIAKTLIATALALCIAFHVMNPALLVAYVFLLGTITALNMPA